MNEYITEVSEAIGEINRLATLCNQLSICTVQVKIEHDVGFADIVIMPPLQPIERYEVMYGVETISFFGEKEAFADFEKVTGRLTELTNRAAQTA